MTLERSRSSSTTNPFSGSSIGRSSSTTIPFSRSSIGSNDFLDVASTLPISRQTNELLVEEVEIIDPKIEDYDIESP